jgi:hypothetical protein
MTLGGLIQTTLPSQSCDYAVAECPDLIPTRSMSPRLLTVGVSSFSQLLRNWPGSRQNGASGPFSSWVTHYHSDVPPCVKPLQTEISAVVEKCTTEVCHE